MSEPTISRRLFNFKLSSGIRRKIIPTEDDESQKHSIAQNISDSQNLTDLPNNDPPRLIDQSFDREKSKSDELFDPSITWAFEGRKGYPVPTEEISRLSKKVFAQSMGKGILFPIRYACVEPKDVAENRVFIYDARTMICERHFFWREENLKFENERTVVLPKATTSGEIQWHVTISRLISNGILQPFQRREYRRCGQEYETVKDWTDPYVYVMYTGVSSRKGQYDCFNLCDYIPPSYHGNSKLKKDRVQNLRLRELLDCTPGNTPVKSSCPDVIDAEEDDDDFQPRPYRRTNFSVLHAMKQELKGGARPMIAQERVKRIALRTGATANNVPRNRQQVYDCKRKLAQGEKIEDPLWEVFKFAQTHSDIIPTAGISNEKAYAAVILPQIIDHVTEILENKTPLCMHYDSTFNVGQYFVSILAFKHPYLVNQPVIPLGFLFHQSKATDIHSIFMQVISQKVPKMDSKLTVFVSDREKAIRTAIKAYFPAAYMAACHDHLTKNIEIWMKARRLASEMEKQILKDIKALLRANSETDFLETETRIASGGLWPVEFCSYYQKNLKADILATSRFKTEPLGVYYPNAGVSNNSSESMNFLYKHFTEVEKRPKTWLEAVQKAYLLMADKYNDVYLAAKLNTGDFKARNSAIEILKKMKISPHTDSLGSEGFDSVFTNGKFVQNVDRGEINMQGLTYKHGLADWLIKMNRITIVHGQFFVRSIGNRTHAVDFIKRECTCGIEDCIELLALDKIIRVNELRATKNVRKTKLQTLTKANERAVSKSSGKKAHVKVGVRSNIISTQQPKKRRLTEQPGQQVFEKINSHYDYQESYQPSTPSKETSEFTDPDLEDVCTIESGIFTETEIFEAIGDEVATARAAENDTPTVGNSHLDGISMLDLETVAITTDSAAVKAGARQDDPDEGSISTELVPPDIQTNLKDDPKSYSKSSELRNNGSPGRLLKSQPSAGQKTISIGTRQRSVRNLLETQSTNVASSSAHGEERYCFCRGGDFGKMRRCDGNHCNGEWYHVKCLRMSSKELNQKIWYCPKCRSADES